METQKPFATVVDALTGQTTTREMTQEEYNALVAAGWTETAPDKPAE